MSVLTDPLGDSPLNRAVQLARLDAHNAKLLAQIDRETAAVAGGAPIRPGSAPLDRDALRGVPVVGPHAAGGAIRGTSPHDSLRYL